MRFLASLFLVLLHGAALSVSAQDLKALANVDGFKEVVAPFLKRHCIKCHGPTRKEGETTLHQMKPDFAAGTDRGKWRVILDRLRKGEMPPEDEPRPPADSVVKVIGWITKELRKADALAKEKSPNLDLPVYGNLVDHETLFRGKEVAALDAPPRIWRNSPFIYNEMLRDLARTKIGDGGKGNKFSQPFSLSPNKGFRDYASMFTIDEPTTGQLLRNAEAIVSIQIGVTKGQGSVKELKSLLATTTPSDADIHRAIKQQFSLALKRAPSEKELARYAGLMKKNTKEVGHAVGVKMTLAAILVHPEVVFRLELGKGPPDGKGRVRLTPREIAFAIAFALTDRRPDKTLLDAAERGELSTREGIARHVLRMFSDQKIDTKRILRFFQEYFGYTDAILVFKDPKDNKNHDPRILVNDTNHLVRYVLGQDKNVLYELLTTNKSFVNYGIDSRTKLPGRAHKKNIQLAYNIVDWPAKQPVELPREQRAGILTQPSWLVAQSLNAENHAILRGKWVRENLLGGHVPDLPITVAAQLPEDPDKTLRQRMSVTQEKYCWNCHQRMNPVGLPFEIYDHFGRFRKSELGKPVDATGVIDKSGVKDVDGEVTDALEMIRKLAKLPRTQEVFVRHAFRYWMGRNETLGDALTLREANRAYTESGGSMKALIVSLITSDSFLYRVPKK